MAGAEEWETVTEALKMRAERGDMFVGLSTAPSTLPSIYGRAAMWVDNTVAYHAHYSSDIDTNRFLCGVINGDKHDEVTIDMDCWWTKNFQKPVVLCKADTVHTNTRPERVAISIPQNRNYPVSHVVCDGHITHSFLPCRGRLSFQGDADNCDVTTGSRCLVGGDMTSFRCQNEAQQVSYTLLCDYRQDCSDNSDENFCVFLHCQSSAFFQCGSKIQCIDSSLWCDGQKDCLTGEDEVDCLTNLVATSLRHFTPLPPPALVQLDPTRNSTSSISIYPLPDAVNSTPLCPESHFLCPGRGHCMPIFLRCNGVKDCHGNEDEEDCFHFSCPGFYRCRDSTRCLHALHVCDGLYHCPKQDDELYCHVDCPTSCTCHGWAFSCSALFEVRLFPHLRYLEGRGSGVSAGHVADNLMLVHLGLAHCGLSRLGQLTLPNLHSLDISDNHFTQITTRGLGLFPNLRQLFIAGNPLTSMIVTTDSNASQEMSLLTVLDVSRIQGNKVFDTAVLKVVPNLTALNLSYNAIERLDGTFSLLDKLTVLDLRGCPVSDFQQRVLTDLPQLYRLYSDNYKLCCPSILPPNFNLDQCFAPFDEISSCESLLRSNIYRVFLSIFASLALVGNLGSFVTRTFVLKQSTVSGFGAFVSHLCFSDFVMGVYLAMLGVADRLYQGSYVWEDTAWRHSVTCKLAGFLSLLSCQVSACIICFITLDRFLVLRFPLGGVRFTARSSHLACVATWCGGVLLAAGPLLPATAHWRFYSQTGICIPLPVTRKEFPGHGYSFAIMIVFNFVLFLLIATGQLLIYLSISANRMSLGTDSKRKEQDANIARRLLTVAVSDFLCWFPIGLLGLLAARGVSIPGEVNVSVAILVLPLNSALNPFLYSLNMLLERRRRLVEQRLVRALEAQLLARDTDN